MRMAYSIFEDDLEEELKIAKKSYHFYIANNELENAEFSRYLYWLIVHEMRYRGTPLALTPVGLELYRTMAENNE